MKKKVLVPIIALLVIAAFLIIAYCMPKTFGKGVNPSEVDHINIFDGQTGTGFTISNPEDIRYIVETIQSHPMKKDGISLGTMGYGFQISYLNQEEKDIIPMFFLNGDDTIRKDPFFYTCDGGLCFDYIKEIEENRKAITAFEDEMKILTLHVKEGDVVKPGDVLITFDTAILDAQIEDINKEIETLMAEIEGYAVDTLNPLANKRDLIAKANKSIEEKKSFLTILEARKESYIVLSDKEGVISKMEDDLTKKQWMKDEVIFYIE